MSRAFVCNRCGESFSKNTGYCPYCDSPDYSEARGTGTPEYECLDCGEEFKSYVNYRKVVCPRCGSKHCASL